MLHRLFAMLLCLTLAAGLAGCAAGEPAPPEEQPTYEYEQPIYEPRIVEDEPEPAEAEIELPEPEPELEDEPPEEMQRDYTGVLEVISQEWPTWQDAYAALLREFAELPLGGEPFISEYVLHRSFILHDMNGDGVPEIMIWEALHGVFFSLKAAYAFEDGQIAQLSIDSDIRGRGGYVLLPPSNRLGIVTTSFESGFHRHVLLVMEGHHLNTTISAMVNWQPRQDGHDFSLYYIRGVEVTTASYSEALAYQWGAHTHWTSLGYVLVEEDEFNNVFYYIFGDLDTAERISLIEITESNIDYFFRN